MIPVAAVGGAETLFSFEEIVRRAGTGDPSAAEQLVHHFHPELTSFARRNGSFDPGGAANLILARSLPEFGNLRNRSEPVVRAYLFRGLRRHLSRERRYDAELPEADINELAAALLDTTGSGGTEDQVVGQQWMSGLLDNLSSSQRFVIVNRYLLDRSYADIAADLGKTPATVRQQCLRARSALRAAIVAAAAIVAWLVASNIGATTDFRLEQEINPTGDVEQRQPEVETPEETGEEELGGSLRVQSLDEPDSTVEPVPSSVPTTSVTTSALPATSTEPTSDGPAGSTRSTGSTAASPPTSAESTSSSGPTTLFSFPVATPSTTAPPPSTATSTAISMEMTAPLPRQPANGATVSGPAVEIAWEGPEGAERFLFEWQTSDNGSDWITSRFSPQEGRGPSISLQSQGNRMIRWRVSGIDSQGRTGPASPWSTYTVN